MVGGMLIQQCCPMAPSKYSLLFSGDHSMLFLQQPCSLPYKLPLTFCTQHLRQPEPPLALFTSPASLRQLFTSYQLPSRGAFSFAESGTSWIDISAS
ncbi:unnamed protein product [Chondrus crispus]|uniref:Uncharacterized protein n=1 Tax=Chondrus crispus TaxID=2769 RepID=R7QFY2_CHOCR|nr:unnamed protein product [Chondrus crispus]CDF36673.1 unnamed protein product [Chondrus crispus]|eukprot:XP_005716492.1 unnamed protein product [Chondrus crispus]